MVAQKDKQKQEMEKQEKKRRNYHTGASIFMSGTASG
jgi:hypothetical protein